MWYCVSEGCRKTGYILRLTNFRENEICRESEKHCGHENRPLGLLPLGLKNISEKLKNLRTERLLRQGAASGFSQAHLIYVTNVGRKTCSRMTSTFMYRIDLRS